MQRALKGITQEQLSEKTGLSTSHISNIETGTTKVGLQTLIKLANALETNPDMFLCDNIQYAKEDFEYYLAKETGDCTELEIRIIADVAQTLKRSIRERLKSLE
jgi:transcriptional regulator with XRE-family HTH domain